MYNNELYHYGIKGMKWRKRKVHGNITVTGHNVSTGSLPSGREKPSNAAEDNELYHHGVMGMHWGIRRYQPYGSGGYDPKKKGKFVGDNQDSSFERKKPIISDKEKMDKVRSLYSDSEILSLQRLNDEYTKLYMKRYDSNTQMSLEDKRELKRLDSEIESLVEKKREAYKEFLGLDKNDYSDLGKEADAELMELGLRLKPLKHSTVGNELYHHGIPGQKWGIRRFQSYETAPRESGKGGKEIGDARFKRDAKKAVKFFNKSNRKKMRANDKLYRKYSKDIKASYKEADRLAKQKRKSGEMTRKEYSNYKANRSRFRERDLRFARDEYVQSQYSLIKSIQKNKAYKAKISHSENSRSYKRAMKRVNRSVERYGGYTMKRNPDGSFSYVKVS